MLFPFFDYTGNKETGLGKRRRASGAHPPVRRERKQMKEKRYQDRLVRDTTFQDICYNAALAAYNAKMYDVAIADFRKLIEHIVWHKGLNCPGKAASVNSPRTFSLQNVMAHCKSNRYRLREGSLAGENILVVHI